MSCPSNNNPPCAKAGCEKTDCKDVTHTGGSPAKCTDQKCTKADCKGCCDCSDASTCKDPAKCPKKQACKAGECGDKNCCATANCAGSKCTKANCKGAADNCTKAHCAGKSVDGKPPTGGKCAREPPVEVGMPPNRCSGNTDQQRGNCGQGMAKVNSSSGGSCCPSGNKNQTADPGTCKSPTCACGPNCKCGENCSC
ncbi:hypothetical protein H696_02293 [Fonticula alba]|uniref:Uncharacterized protein n=1 Tax=Fonticula alba TaxID=691883 RepID=A0A058ZAH2_FONAL|nr:hypothetical protein H696_02293 [Fonticula alba]KCV71345.1 hypothetical protein H696_02293 [Fonticula alba]|eukprot:XP_009494468.1 hypothetical protein H696_02293 [Fonticula alba]